MACNSLIDLSVVHDDVGIAYSTGSHEVDGVAPKVGVGEQLGPIPDRGILRSVMSVYRLKHHWQRIRTIS